MLKSTNKMILVPYSQFERLTSEITKDKVHESMKKGEEKDNIIVNHTLDSVNPINKKNKGNIENKSDNDNTGNTNNNNNKEKLNESVILTHFSSKFSNKVKLLINYIKTQHKYNLVSRGNS